MKLSNLYKHYVFSGLDIVLNKQINMDENQQKKKIKKLNISLRNLRMYQCFERLNHIIDSKQKLQRTFSISHVVISRLLDSLIDLTLLNGYIILMKKHEQQQRGIPNLKQLTKLVQIMPDKILGYFCQAFNIKLDQMKIAPIVEQLSNNNEYGPALKLAQCCSQKKPLLEIVAKYAQKQKDKRSLDFVVEQIVNMGYKKQDFIRLHFASLRLQMIAIYSEEGYEYAEEVFRYNPKMMALIADKLAHDKQKQNLLAFCSRNPDVINSMRDKNQQQYIRKELKEGKKVKDNSLLNDKFKPSISNKFFHLQDFKIGEKDVFFVDSESPNLKECLLDINNSDLIGLDTESYVARSKFSTDEELIATIQISNGNRVYIFDAKNIRNPIIGEELSKFFCNQNKKVVGHTLLQDLQVTLKALNINKEYKCECIDVKPIFKKLHPDLRAGLTSICEKVLGKPICKSYTLTDWGRRPLLKNQLHYAALDAVVVIHIYNKLKAHKNNNK